MLFKTKEIQSIRVLFLTLIFSTQILADVSSPEKYSAIPETESVLISISIRESASDTTPQVTASCSILGSKSQVLAAAGSIENSDSTSRSLDTPRGFFKVHRAESFVLNDNPETWLYFLDKGPHNLENYNFGIRAKRKNETLGKLSTRGVVVLDNEVYEKILELFKQNYAVFIEIKDATPEA